LTSGHREVFLGLKEVEPEVPADLVARVVGGVPEFGISYVVAVEQSVQRLAEKAGHCCRNIHVAIFRQLRFGDIDQIVEFSLKIIAHHA
jgi:hypothetical protein